MARAGDLQRLMVTTVPGAELELRVLRGDRLTTLTAVPEELAAGSEPRAR
jgi:hypothetical protein